MSLVLDFLMFICLFYVTYYSQISLSCLRSNLTGLYESSEKVTCIKRLVYPNFTSYFRSGGFVPLKCIVLLSQEGLSLQPKVVSAVDFLLKEMAFPPDTIVAFAECNEVSNLNHQNQRL